jgi:drug/metabolite transporter (DMT)-like permease
MNTPSLWPLLIATGVTLGLGVPIAKAAAQQGVAAIAFALWPTLAAGAVLAVLGRLRRGIPKRPARLLRFGTVAGLLGHALPMSATFWLSAHAGAAFASLALTLPPVFTLAITLLSGLERPAPRRLAAVAAGLGGALVMLCGRGGSFVPSAGIVVLALLIPASISVANVYRSRCMPAGESGEWLASSTLLASSSMLAAAGLATGDVAVPLEPPAVLWLLVQALALVIGYLLYFALQRRAEPVTFSFIGYVMTLSGVVIGTLGFGERLPWTLWPALALVLGALRLLHRGAIDPRTDPALPPP